MKNIILLIVGLAVLVALFFVVDELSQDTARDPSGEVSEPTATSTGNGSDTTGGEPANDMRRVTSEAGVLPDGLIFTMRVPTTTDVRVENEDIYRIIYAGADNEPPALTDGIGMSIQVLEKPADQTTEEFAVERFTDEDNVIENTFTSHQAYGREIYTLQVEGQLNNVPAEHVYFGIDDTHVAFITISIYGTETAREEYERYVDDMLSSLTFMQISGSEDDRIKVEEPKAGAEISSPLTVRGEARGQWYFEATFPVVVVDWDGRIIGEGHATAQDEWMTEEFVPFEGTIEYELEEASTASSRGTVIFQRSNASGLPENDAAVEIPVEFAE